MKHSNQRFRLRDLYQFSGYKFCDSFVDNDSILMVLKRTGKTGKCPVCGKRCRHIHKKRKRRIRDLDLACSKTYVWFAYFDIVCSCGYDGVEELDFVESYSRYTKRFEEKVVVLCKFMCIKDVANEMRNLNLRHLPSHRH
ncbi:MAG: transposase family protein [Candidatus Woesearchaeota archaeon]